MNTVAVIGADAPPKAIQIGGIDDSGDLQPIKVNASGQLELAGDAITIANVGGLMAVASATFSRPANTDAYAAKDAVSDSTTAPTVLNFADLARENGGSGYITKARLITNQSTNVARFRLHLYHTAPTAINDNAAFTLLWANRSNRIGYLDFDACQTEGSGSDAANALNTTIRLAFDCAAADRDLYGLLETLDAFTPASGQSFHIELTGDIN